MMRLERLIYFKIQIGKSILVSVLTSKLTLACLYTRIGPENKQLSKPIHFSFNLLKYSYLSFTLIVIIIKNCFFPEIQITLLKILNKFISLILNKILIYLEITVNNICFMKDVIYEAQKLH